MSKDVPYQNIDFFREKMASHTRVQHYSDVSTDDYYIYRIERRDGLPSVTVLLSDAYKFSQAEFLSLPRKVIGMINYILIAKPHAGYTALAAEMANAREIGMGMIGELMGALNFRKVSEYKKKTVEG